MKTKIMKVLGVVMTIAMLASFMVAGAPVSAAGGPLTPSINEWEGVTLPSMIPGTDVDLIEQAKDGTIFISVYNEAAPSWSMYKSTDGYTWTLTNINNQANRITAIEPSANYAVDKTVYVAINTSGLGYTTLYRCTNGAAVGTPVGEMGMISAGMGASLNASYIYSLDSYYDGSYVWLLAATDIDVFAIRDDRGLTTVWTDMQLSETLGGEYSDYDPLPEGVEVYKAMFAPDYASTGVIWAVYYDEFASTALATRFPTLAGDTDGYGIIARSSGSTLWGTVITPVIIWDEVSSGPAKAECDSDFSAAYSSTSNPEIYAALSFWGSTDYDDIYRIECGFYGALANVTPFDVDPTGRIDFCSIEVDGSNIIVGSYDMSFIATEVWYSHNDGTTWAMSARNPTGSANETCNLLISKYGATDGMAFAATGGTQSAISISDDMGYTWAQTAFIDDDIAEIKDIAFHPTTKAALLVTRNAAWDDSLWVTSDVTTPVVNWKRIFCEEYNTDINFTMVEYSADGAAVMVYDKWADVIFRSTDNANTFGNWRNTASWGDINAWLVPNASTVYAVTNNGFWSTALVGSRLPGIALVSIAMSGDSLTVGTDVGTAYASINKGNTWGTAIVCATFDEDVFVAFDALYASNNLFYYATEEGKVGKVLLSGNNLSTAAGSNVDYNALYLAGSTTTSSTTTPDIDPVIDGGTLQIVDDATGAIARTATLGSDLPITGIVNGPFIAGEVLLVIGDDLVATSATDITGFIQVQGVTSGATGIVNVGTLTVPTGYTAADTITVTSSNIIVTDLVSGGGSTPSTDEAMYRLLLHQADNNWEGAVTELADMFGLWYSAGSNILWTIVDGDMLYAFEDFLSGKTLGVTAVEVNKVAENPTKSVTVSWTHMNEDDGTTYLISYSYTLAGVTYTNYAYKVVSSLIAVGTAVSTTITGLNPSTEYTFMVRVANDSPIQSRWSSGVKVITTAYLYAPTPMSPSQNLVTSSLHPTFTWSSVVTAVAYNIQISQTATFGTLIDSATVAVTGYTYTGDGLAYDTDYYWRVQAVAADGTVSEWSSYDPYYGLMGSTGAVSVFHTMMDPEVVDGDVTLTVTQTQTSVELTVTQPTYTIPVPEFTVTAPAPPASTVTTITNVVEIPDPQTPAYIWAIVAIGALLTIAVIVLIIRTRRVV